MPNDSCISSPPTAQWQTPHAKMEAAARRVTFASTIEEKTISRLVSFDEASDDLGQLSLDSVPGAAAGDPEHPSLDLMDLLAQISMVRKEDSAARDRAASADSAIAMGSSTAMGALGGFDEALDTDQPPNATVETQSLFTVHTNDENDLGEPDFGEEASFSLLDVNDALGSSLLRESDDQLASSLAAPAVLPGASLLGDSSEIRAGRVLPQESLSVDLTAVGDRSGASPNLFSAVAPAVASPGASLADPSLPNPPVSHPLIPNGNEPEPQTLEVTEVAEVMAGDFLDEMPVESLSALASTLTSPQTQQLNQLDAAKALGKAAARIGGFLGTPQGAIDPLLPSPGVFFAARSGSLGALEDSDSNTITGRPLFKTPPTAGVPDDTPTGHVPGTATPHGEMHPSAAPHIVSEALPSAPVPLHSLFSSPRRLAAGRGIPADSAEAKPSIAPVVPTPAHRVVSAKPQKATRTAPSPPSVAEVRRTRVSLASVIALPRPLSLVARRALHERQGDYGANVRAAPPVTIVLFPIVAAGATGSRYALTLEAEDGPAGTLASAAAGRATVWQLQAASPCMQFRRHRIDDRRRAEQFRAYYLDLARGTADGVPVDPADLLERREKRRQVASLGRSDGASVREQNLQSIGNIFRADATRGRLDAAQSRQAVHLVFQPPACYGSGIFTQTLRLLANQQTAVIRLVGIVYSRDA